MVAGMAITGTEVTKISSRLATKPVLKNTASGLSPIDQPRHSEAATLNNTRNNCPKNQQYAHYL